MERVVSYEPQIAWLCPHVLTNVAVDVVATTASLPYPVAGSLSVRVDGRDVPAGGLRHAAQLWSSTFEPYSRDKEQSLTVKTDAGTATFTFPARYLSASDVCRIFNANPLVVATAADRRFRLGSRKTGSESLVSVEGTALESLGLAIQRVSRGVNQYPGWSLGRDSAGDSRVLIFQEALPANLPVTVGYRAVANWCPRCQGSGVENDLRATPQGAVATVANHDLLYQRCLKVVLTRLGSNPYVTRYGTNLIDMIGKKNVAGLSQAVNEEVRNALSLMQSIDRQQTKIQSMTLAERLGEVVRVQTTVDPQDPTIMQVDVEVRSMSRQPVQLTVVFSVSGVSSTQGTKVL